MNLGTVAAAVVAVTAGTLLARGAGAAVLPSLTTGNDTPDEPEQLPGILDQLTTAMDANQYDTAALGAGQADLNVRAFLDMIAFAEGTAGPNGYRTLFGGGLFDSFADHPRTVVTRMSNGRELSSSAAGRYQILRRTWDVLARRLELTDFSPANQDAAAIELIRERGALADVQAGRFADAVNKIRPIWASMPGAGYGQPERQLASLERAYTQAGGNLA